MTANFQVLGIHHKNKGALLMLEAIRAKLSDAFPESQISVSEEWPTDMRLEYGLGSFGVHSREKSFDAKGVLRNVFRKSRRTDSFASFSVDIMFDASGFAYGDYWGLTKLEKRRQHIEHRRKGINKLIIMLPQAFGPFETPGMCESFNRILDLATLVFARDKLSLAYISKVSPGRLNMRMAPDFTNLLEASLPSRLSHLRGLSLIIPNQKMISGHDNVRYERYLGFLQLAVGITRRAGRMPAILIHEGAQDRRLADEVNERLDKSVLVVDEPSPLVTKAIVSSAELVISSRFHGLVSALSAGVPSLACGWSHKYVELMDEYDCSRHMVDVDANDAEWVVRLETFLGESAKSSFRDALRLSAKREKERSEAMWNEVFSVVDQVLSPA